ncbi:MAG TPA: protein kinase, partial [Labilithrix sp.]
MTRAIKNGRYTLLRRLGEGSQGETWEARDEIAAGKRPRDSGDLRTQWNDFVRRANEPPSPHETVAVKCFRVGTAKAWKDVELAEREARTLASIDHDRLPRYVEHFEEDGTLYLVMERIAGESVASRRRAGQVFGPAEVVRMLDDAARALGYLHARSPPIVHRDIKPGN